MLCKILCIRYYLNTRWFCCCWYDNYKIIFSDSHYLLLCSLVLCGHGLSLEVPSGSKLSSMLDNVVTSPKNWVLNFEHFTWANKMLLGTNDLCSDKWPCLDLNWCPWGVWHCTVSFRAIKCSALEEKTYFLTYCHHSPS